MTESESSLWLARFDAHRLEVRVLICLNWLMDGYFLDRRHFLIRAGGRRFGLEIPDLSVLARGLSDGAIAVEQSDPVAFAAAQRIAAMIDAEASRATHAVETVTLEWNLEENRLAPVFH